VGKERKHTLFIGQAHDFPTYPTKLTQQNIKNPARARSIINLDSFYIMKFLKAHYQPPGKEGPSGQTVRANQITII
jgi:hypothetical protein